MSKNTGTAPAPEAPKGDEPITETDIKQETKMTIEDRSTAQPAERRAVRDVEIEVLGRATLVNREWVDAPASGDGDA